MKETFDLIAAILNAGKSILDNLFKKRLTKKEVEKIISEHQVNIPKYKEKILIVISENQEMSYNEDTGEIIIVNTEIDKRIFMQQFLKELRNKMEEKNETEWEEIKTIDESESLKSSLSTDNEELEMIRKIKEKHNSVYGKQ